MNTGYPRAEVLPFGSGHDHDRAFLAGLKTKSVRQLKTLAVELHRTCAPSWKLAAVERAIARAQPASIGGA